MARRHRPALDAIERRETRGSGSLDNQLHMAAGALALRMVLIDLATDDDAGARIDMRKHSVREPTTHVVEIHVDAFPKMQSTVASNPCSGNGCCTPGPPAAECS